MRRYLLTLVVTCLLLCVILFAGCTSTSSTNATTAPPSSTAPAASPTAGTPATTISSAPNGTVPSAVNGSITGTKFNDLNGNGRRDPMSGPGLSGWTIVLERQEQNSSAWSEVQRTTTGGMGAYTFSGLSAGHYRVSEVMQPGWTQTFPAENNGTTELTISSGRFFWDSIDFGNFRGSNATGTVGTTGTGTATASTGTTASGSTAPATTIATTAATTAGAVTVSLTAQNIKFDTSTITVPAGSTVTVNFNNKDASVPHNFAVYSDSSATTPIFKGQIVTGPTTTTYTFTAPSTPGTYFFRCDVHPTQMTGQFVVE
jgi:plastocyanin